MKTEINDRSSDTSDKVLRQKSSDANDTCRVQAMKLKVMQLYNKSVTSM